MEPRARTVGVSCHGLRHNIYAGEDHTGITGTNMRRAGGLACSLSSAWSMSPCLRPGQCYGTFRLSLPPPGIYSPYSGSKDTHSSIFPRPGETQSGAQEQSILQRKLRISQDTCAWHGTRLCHQDTINFLETFLCT